jgi:adenosine deaminase
MKHSTDQPAENHLNLPPGADPAVAANRDGRGNGLREVFEAAETDRELVSFIRSLPKAELHLHMEGSAPWALVQQLDPARFGAFTHPPIWHPDHVFPSFESFLLTLREYCAHVFSSLETYHAAARGLFHELMAENVRYVELSFQFGFVPRLGITGRDLVQTLLDAAPEGFEVRVYAGFLRNDWRPEQSALMEELLRCEELSGIDLHGVETIPLEDWTPEFWRRAEEAGKQVRAHVGEFRGAAHVREVVQKLGLKRVMHGVRAAEDPEILQFLLDEGVQCDMCPISNVRLRVQGAERFARHPLPRFLERGIPVTISSDDTFAFGNNITVEHVAAMRGIGLSKSRIIQMQRTAWRAARIDEARRARILEELRQIEDGLEAEA